MTKEKIKAHGMRRFIKILKGTILTIITIVFLGLLGIFTFNKICLHNEAGQIKDYGKKIEVFDGTINVLDEGKGDETIVLLPGYGTGSPGLDFKPLVKELKQQYRVVVIEPFGYGLSSQTKRARTSKNIVEEIHKVVEKLDIDSFTLVGHSLGGIYGLDYIDSYPNDVRAFVGLDNSVPDQPWVEYEDGMNNFIQKSGLMRLLLASNSEIKDMLRYDGIDEETFKQQRMLNLKNLSNETVRREGRAMKKMEKSLGQLYYLKNYQFYYLWQSKALLN